MSWIPGRSDRELDEEIRFHIDMETEKNLRAGMKDDEARRAARRSFGAQLRIREEVRDVRRTRVLEDAARDVHYALRTLRHAPGYAITTILTIGLAIGVAAAILTFVEATLFRPLPYAGIERVVTLWETNGATGENQLEVSPANFLDWQARNRSFEALGILAPHGLDLRRGERVIAVESARVSQQFFAAVGVKPLFGRLFEAADYDPGAEPRVVLSHDTWIKRFDGDRRMGGQTIELDGKPAIVLGVLPRGVEYPAAAAAEVYAPLHLYGGEKTARVGNWMYGAGRLREGVTPEQAAADMDRIARTLGQEHPETNQRLGVRIIALREMILGSTRRLLVPLAAGSLCLLIVACTNIAALNLARGAARRRELAVRAALGANTGRLVRQLVTESILLNAAAAAAAYLVAFLIVTWMARLAPEGLRSMSDVHAGLITLALVCAITAFATIFSGMIPALRLVRSGLAKDLESSRRDSGLTSGEARLQSGLVIAQLALTLLLLTGAGLLVRSLQKLTSHDLGFEPRGLATMQMYLYDLHPKKDERAEFVRTSLQSLRSLPGVTDAAATSELPFDPAMSARDDFEIVGRPRRTGESLVMLTTAITPDYFRTIRAPVRSGRDFTRFDDLSSQRVAIVNEAAAARFWRGTSPIDSRVRVGVMGPPLEWTIVGVAENVRSIDYAEEQAPTIYVPVAQSGVGGMNYIVRTTARGEGILTAMQDRIWQLTPSQSIVSAALVPRLVARTLQTRVFALALITGFAIAGLLVSAIGLFGLLTYIGARRRLEIGIRLALGATPDAIERLFIRRGLALTGAGVAVGLLLSVSFTRVLESFLYETSSLDPVAIGGVLLTMTAVTFLASWIPARRAASLDAAQVLRGD